MTEDFIEGYTGKTFWQIYKLNHDEYDIIIRYKKVFMFGMATDFVGAERKILHLSNKIRYFYGEQSHIMNKKLAKGKNCR